MIDQTISRYKILEKLGSGGMGDVYKAEDTKLGRQVALKFLASHLVSDPEIHKRFEREARAAASLSHPNICHVYEIDEADGTTFLAMELVKGESLDARIAAGLLPLKDVLDFGRQIAEGLQEAHANGVVHRDIKPGNIIVTPDGRVKILDFGLALLTEGSKLTKLDQTVGTVAYMSPEQAQGIEVDHRTDIWALGCVLYEMVTGQRPFTGQYDQALLYEIVNQEQEPITGLRAGVPMELEFIVAKCLAKDREDRTEATQEVARDLRTLSDKLKSGRSTVLSAAGGPSAISSVAPSEAASGGDGGRKAWIVAAGVLGVVAIAGWASYFSRPPTAPSRELRLSVVPPPGASLIPLGSQYAPMLSPDGSQLLLRTSEGAFLRPLTSTDLIPVEDLGEHAAFSPDGRWIVRVGHPSHALEKRRLPDGPWQRLADPGRLRGVAWGSRGWILMAGRSLRAVPEDGGEPVRALPGSWESVRWPQFLPDGERFIFSGRRTGEDEQSIYLSRLGSDEQAEEPVLLVVNPGSARFSPVAGGRLFFVQGSRLYAQKLNIAEGRLEGEPQPVADDVAWSSVYGLSYFDVAQDGTLAWRSGKISQDRLTWFDREGRAIETMGPPENFRYVSLSPDGRRAVASVMRSASDGNLLLESGQSGARELDPDPVYHWFRDSNTLITTAGESGEVRLVEQAALPNAEQRTVANLPQPTLPLGGVSRDGRRFVLGGLHPLLLDLDELDKLTPLGADGEEILSAGFSPDGQWIVYRTDGQVYVQSRDLASPRRQISRTGGYFPVWRSDGREILFIGDGKMMSVAVEADGGRFRAAEPVPLFDVELGRHVLASSRPFDVTADGSRILIAVPEEQPGSDSIQIATGWQAGLQ